jgi:hypothetical protein
MYAPNQARQPRQLTSRRGWQGGLIAIRVVHDGDFHPLSLSSLSFPFVRKLGGRKIQEKEGERKMPAVRFGCGCRDVNYPD